MTVHSLHFTIRNSPFAILLLCAVLLLALPLPAQAREDGPGDGVGWWTVDAGGGSSRGGAYGLRGTAGQPEATVASTGGRYSLRGGFWQRRLQADAPADRHLYLPLVGQAPAPFVYHEDFEEAVGGEWPQRVALTTAPNGQRFLGEFGNQTVSLTLADLPDHSQVTVRFDLYVLRSWDGNQAAMPPGVAAYAHLAPAAVARIGPDRWHLAADDQTLLDTTFANIPGFGQAYPDAYPGGNHPAQTGAVATDSLGYVFGANGMDATYRIQHTFAHSGRALTLAFGALGLQSLLADESWGLDNVTVTLATAAQTAQGSGVSTLPVDGADTLWLPDVDR